MLRRRGTGVLRACTRSQPGLACTHAHDLEHVDRIAEKAMKQDLAAAQKALATEKARSKGLEKELAEERKRKREGVDDAPPAELSRAAKENREPLQVFKHALINACARRHASHTYARLSLDAVLASPRTH